MRLVVVARQQVLEDLAEQFGIERDLLLERGVFLDRELVTGEQLDQAIGYVGLALGEVFLVEVDFLPSRKKYLVGNVERISRPLRKSVNPDNFPAALLDQAPFEIGVSFEIPRGDLTVQTFEETAV